MRILFVLDRVENPASANAQLACRLAEQLLAQGHEIHLLELWDGENPPPAPPAGASQHTLAFADERLMNHALENGAKAGSPVPLRLLRLAAHPTAVAAAFRQLVLHAPRRTVDSRREMERLDAEFHFDAVCAVCAPYRTAFALETAQIGGKKLLWQLDPYASCCEPLIQRSSRPRPCRIMRAGRFPPGAARYRCWASRFYCRAGRCLRTRGCGAYFAAVCTPRYGSRILRWNCLPR